jgi:hypothetical protein
MSKMGSHDPFGHFKHKLWPKKRLGIKLTIWFPTTKSWELPRFPYVQVACNISLESSRQGPQLWNFISIKGLHTKLWAPKVTRIPTLGISGLPLGSRRTKWHLGVGLMAKHKVYYKGEGGGSPQVRAMVSLVSPWLSVACPCTKVLQLRTNQLVVWFV